MNGMPVLLRREDYLCLVKNRNLLRFYGSAHPEWPILYLPTETCPKDVLLAAMIMPGSCYDT